MRPTDTQPLALAGYSTDLAGVLDALSDLGEARSLLAELLADGDDRVALLGAREHLERAMARRLPRGGDA